MARRDFAATDQGQLGRAKNEIASQSIFLYRSIPHFNTMQISAVGLLNEIAGEKGEQRQARAAPRQTREK